MKQLTANEVLEAKDFKTETVDVPEWGGCVIVRTLSMGARYHISEASIKDDGKMRHIDNARFAILTFHYGLVDPKVSIEQAEKFMDKSSAAIERVLAAIWRVSGIGEAELKNGQAQA